jgi:pyruvate dehydrogenase E2 component (dihydrolipoamide acetyltransferase)
MWRRQRLLGKSAGIQRHRGTELLPFEGMRKVIADRMMESLHNSAQLAHKMKVDMTEIIRLRESYKQEGIKISINDVLIKIVSQTLLEFPMLNASLTEEGILTHNYVNMGIAVAVENGLIVPVIRDADLLALKEISASGSVLVDKAKSGSLETEDYTGGTFTISNLGMFDIDEFTAIINPPESAILAVGKIEKVPVVRDDEIVIRPIMTLSLTYDHRVVDGAPAAQFLQKVKKVMENPYLLL